MELDSTTKNAIALRQNMELTTLAAQLYELTEELHRGDTRHAQSILMEQSITLSAVFEIMIDKASKSQSPEVMRRYIDTALKAQEQSRKTIATLANMHQPKAATLIQNNHAENQQINIKP